MSFRSMFVLAVAVVTGMVDVEVPGQKLLLSAGSQKVFGAEPQKQKDPSHWLPSGDMLGFTGKGGEPFALERSVPGLLGALMLTSQQKQKIGAAVAEKIQSEKVRAAVVLAKLNPNATQAQKEEAQKLVTEARGKLRQLVGQILTDEQKKLVANMNAAAEQARREVSESLQAEQAPDKHDEPAMKRWREQVHQRMDAAMQKRTVATLNPAQKAAFEQAAAAQAAAEKAAKDKPKGSTSRSAFAGRSSARAATATPRTSLATTSPASAPSTCRAESSAPASPSTSEPRRRCRSTYNLPTAPRVAGD